MKERKRIIKLALIIPIIVLYRFDMFLYAETMDNHMGEIFLMHFFGGSYDMDEIDITVAVLGLIGVIIICIEMADFFTCDFTECPEYIMTRYVSREIWFWKKIKSCIYFLCFGIGCYMLPYFCQAIATTAFSITWKDYALITSAFLMMALFTYCTVIAINIVALRYGNTIGFIAVYSVIIISTVVSLISQRMEQQGVSISVMQLINPMSNIFLSWNLANVYVVRGILYYVILSAILTCILKKQSNTVEIGINRKTQVE